MSLITALSTSFSSRTSLKSFRIRHNMSYTNIITTNTLSIMLPTYPRSRSLHTYISLRYTFSNTG